MTKERNIVAIKQPYFMPYIGFWQEVNAVDTYIFFDDVNFITRGWINRNNILVGGQRHLFTLALEGASQNKHINDITICDDFVKLRKTIEMAYRKAPHFEETHTLLNKIFDYENRNLARFVGNSIERVSEHLGFNTRFAYSSELVKDETLKRQDKIIDIRERLGATAYYDSMGATELYSKTTFREHGIDLSFVETPRISYPQFKHFDSAQHKNDFVPFLSIIDTLMFLSKEEVMALCNQIKLV